MILPFSQLGLASPKATSTKQQPTKLSGVGGKRVEWRWKIRDRTELNQEFSCLIPLEQNWEYRKIQKEAVRWHKHGLSYAKIAKLLGVTDKTVKKAITRNPIRP